MKEMEGCANCQFLIDDLCARTTPKWPNRNGWCEHWKSKKPEKKLVPYLIHFASDNGDVIERRICTDGTSDDLAWFRETVGDELERTRGGRWLCIGAESVGGDSDGNDVR